jgi:hypothetical protein
MFHANAKPVTEFLFGVSWCSLSLNSTQHHLSQERKISVIVKPTMWIICAGTRNGAPFLYYSQTYCAISADRQKCKFISFLIKFVEIYEVFVQGVNHYWNQWNSFPISFVSACSSAMQRWPSPLLWIIWFVERALAWNFLRRIAIPHRHNTIIWGYVPKLPKLPPKI